MMEPWFKQGTTALDLENEIRWHMPASMSLWNEWTLREAIRWGIRNVAPDLETEPAKAEA